MWNHTSGSSSAPRQGESVSGPRYAWKRERGRLLPVYFYTLTRRWQNLLGGSSRPPPSAGATPPLRVGASDGWKWGLAGVGSSAWKVTNHYCMRTPSPPHYQDHFGASDGQKLIPHLKMGGSCFAWKIPMVQKTHEQSSLPSSIN